jgi:membrane protease YdiL (CAAX protease family)
MADDLKYRWIGMSSATLALLLLGLLPFASEKLLGHPLQLPLSSLILQSLFVAMSYSLACASKRQRQPLLRLGLVKPEISKRQWAFLILGMLGLSQTLDAAIQLGGWGDQGSLGLFQEVMRDLRGWNLSIAILGLGFAPALGEEFLFRGLLLRGLMGRMGAMGALLASSLVFGLVHFDPVHSVAATLIGLYLGIVLLRTGSLLPAITCHAINNVIAVISSAFISESAPLPAWQLPLGCAALALGLFSTLRISPHSFYREAACKPIKTGEV